MELSDWVTWKIIVWCLAIIVCTSWAPTSSQRPGTVGRRGSWRYACVCLCECTWGQTRCFFSLYIFEMWCSEVGGFCHARLLTSVCVWACLCVAGVSHFLSRIQIRLVRRRNSFQFHLWRTEKHVNTWWAGRTALRSGCFILNWCMKEQLLREGVLSAVLCSVERAGLVYVKSVGVWDS